MLECSYKSLVEYKKSDNHTDCSLSFSCSLDDLFWSLTLVELDTYCRLDACPDMRTPDDDYLLGNCKFQETISVEDRIITDDNWWPMMMNSI